MNVTIDLENASSVSHIPDETLFHRWVKAAQDAAPAAAGSDRDGKTASLGIRIVDESESALLNNTYRGKNQPTNVLSFSADLPPFALAMLEEVPLGDLAICAPLVLEEAAAQHKQAEAHWAHLVVHGVLHLNGLDHQEEEQAQVMESLETDILRRLGYHDPYQHSVTQT